MKSVFLVVMILTFTSMGCSTMYFDRRTHGHSDMENEEWHHDGIFGLVEFSDPVDMNKRCGGKAWDSVKTSEQFIQGFVSLVTSSLYNPWEVKYSCK